MSDPLASALGLPEGHAGVLPEARTAHFVHLDGNAVEHLAVELAYQASFGEVLSEVMDWEEDNQRGEIEGSDGGKSARAQLDTGPGSYAGAGYGAALSGATSNVLGLPLASLDASIESGWNYCKSYSYSGKINDGDSDKGGYNMAFKFYYVTKEEVEDDYDRWLVISELTSSMSDYYTEDGNKHKGWYMRKMDLKATIGQYTGDIDEWSPSTTVGSSSRTSTIGAGISSSGPDASYSVATTNSTEDVSIKVDGNVSNNDGVGGQDWVEHLEGGACALYDQRRQQRRRQGRAGALLPRRALSLRKLQLPDPQVDDLLSLRDQRKHLSGVRGHMQLVHPWGPREGSEFRPDYVCPHTDGDRLRFHCG